MVLPVSQQMKTFMGSPAKGQDHTAYRDGFIVFF